MIGLLRTREWLDATRAKTPCDHDALPSLCQTIDEIDETLLEYQLARTAPFLNVDLTDMTIQCTEPS